MYGLDRFSVDLDFDIIKNVSLNVIKKEVKKILIPYGKVQEETNTTDYQKNHFPKSTSQSLEMKPPAASSGVS